MGDDTPEVLQQPLSFSKLDSYASCPERFRLVYIERVERIPQGAFIAGKAIHETIEAAEHKQLWSASLGEVVEVFQGIFTTAVEDAGGPAAIRWGGRKSKAWPKGETIDWWIAAAPVMLERYVVLRRADAEMDTHVDVTEMEVLAQLPGDLPPVRGFIDAFMLVDHNGERIIRDYKSGSYAPEPTQLATYAWILRQTGAEVSLGQYVMLRRRDVESRVLTFDLEPYLELIPRLYADLHAGVRAGLFPLRPSSFCTSCAVKRACSYGRLLPEPEE